VCCNKLFSNGNFLVFRQLILRPKTRDNGKTFLAADVTGRAKPNQKKNQLIVWQTFLIKTEKPIPVHFEINHKGN
jgi:hypothetical protein